MKLQKFNIQKTFKQIILTRKFANPWYNVLFTCTSFVAAVCGQPYVLNNKCHNK